MSSGGQAAGALFRRLQGKIAIITGGASGIGEATVRLFTNHGATVIIADISDVPGSKLAGCLSPAGTFIHCDVSKEQDVRAAVDLAVEKHGRLDIMFNNAGISHTQKGSVADYEMEHYERVMNVNAKGVMHGIKHAARVMIPNRKGSIISTASIAGIVGGMGYPYTASKHAIIGLTKNGAAELGKYGIRVNCISPSGFATNLSMEHLEKEASEETRAAIDAFADSIGNLKEASLRANDVAEAALYLASEDSKYISGHNVVLDGGITVVNKDWGMYK